MVDALLIVHGVKYSLPASCFDTVDPWKELLFGSCGISEGRLRMLPELLGVDELKLSLYSKRRSVDGINETEARLIGQDDMQHPSVAVVGNPFPGSADKGVDVVNAAPGKIQPSEILKMNNCLLSGRESVLVDPWYDMFFGSRKNVKEMVIEPCFDLSGFDLLKFPLVCLGRSVGRINETEASVFIGQDDLEHPCEDVRKSAAIELVNMMEADLELKALALNSFLRLPVTNTRPDTDVLVMAAKFMFLNKRKKMLVLYHLAANLFRTMLSKIELKSCPDQLPVQDPSANRGSPTQNLKAGGNSGSNAVRGSGTNSTGSGPGGVSGGQGNGGEDNGNNFNVRRGPAAIVAGTGWFHLFLVILTIVVELLNLYTAWSSAEGNSVMNLFTADNALGMIIVAIITSVIMLAIYLVVTHRPYY